MKRLLYKLSRWISSRPFRSGTPLREDIERALRRNRDEILIRRTRAETAAGASGSGEAVAPRVRVCPVDGRPCAGTQAEPLYRRCAECPEEAAVCSS